MNPNTKHARAFTLIEMLVVVGLLGILIAIALPALSDAKSKTTEVAEAGTLRNLNIALYRAYKAKDPQFQPGGLLHPDSTDTLSAVAYLYQTGYIQ
jgi:prepilin-type N-terminal cleavage/methylation domain-containing protein